MDRAASGDEQREWFELAWKGGALERQLVLLDMAPALLNAQDRNGHSALMHACEWGVAQVVELLCEQGADVELQSSKVRTGCWLPSRFAACALLTDRLLRFVFVSSGRAARR